MVIGCDISKEMLTVAINKNFKITTPNLIRCDVEYLPFKNDVLDCIISIRLMGHIPPQNRISITNEFKRITKQWIIISYANSITIGGLFRRIKSFIYHDEWYQINPKSLEQELNDQDLQIKLIEYLQTEIPDKRFHSIITHFQNLLLKYFAETYIVLIEKKNEKV
ncbi:MAG: class I SAM-dependent methyltransferase [Candidatus Lokiarchaeota archaeon]|nr:class I SAM-dependent methyltransferase [Candidatus Lokiarchaeota archaeon]